MVCLKVNRVPEFVRVGSGGCALCSMAGDVSTMLRTGPYSPSSSRTRESVSVCAREYLCERES